MSCPGLHCPGCGQAGGGWVLAILATAGVAWWVTANIVLIAVCTAVVAAVAGVVIVRAIYRELRVPVWRPGQAQVNGPTLPPAPALTAEQMAGLAQLGQAIHDVRAAGQIAAIREAGYRAYDQRRDQ